MKKEPFLPVGPLEVIFMMSYMEYKLITSAPLSSSIYDLWKNAGAPYYSIIYNLAKKMERMGIIKIENTTSNGRNISRIYPGEAYPAFKAICDNFFQQYYSRATEILKEQISQIASERGLHYQIIGGQLDPTRAYMDIQIAIPEEESAKWKNALNIIEQNINYLGLTTKPDNQYRYLIRKLHVIPLPFHNIELELREKLENKEIFDIHYNSGYSDLAPYFLYLIIGARNG